MNPKRMASLVLLIGAAALVAATALRHRATSAAVEEASGIPVTLGGLPWKRLSAAHFAPLQAQRLVGPDGREHVGPPLSEALHALGVQRAKKVHVTDFGGAAAIVGAATLEDPALCPLLARDGEDVRLVGRAGDLQDPGRWLASIERIDIAGAALDPAAAAERERETKRRSRSDADALAEARVVEVVHESRRVQVSYDRIRELATGKGIRKGREVAVAPIAAVLESLSLPRGGRVRVLGQESETVVEWDHDGPIAEFALAPNRQGQPNFIRTTPGTAATMDPAQFRGPEHRQARRAIRQATRHGTSEVKRVYRIEVLR